jgi:hypothetical protein
MKISKAQGQVFKNVGTYPSLPFFTFPRSAVWRIFPTHFTVNITVAIIE